MGGLRHENLGGLKNKQTQFGFFRKELYIGSKWYDDTAV